MKRSQRNQQNTSMSTKTVHPKFMQQREEFASVHPIKPMNQKQRTYIELLDTKDIILATGLAGTSKTYLATAIACDLLRAGKINKIIFSRPNISNSKSLGFFAGDLESKMCNWLAPVLSVVKERMGVGGFEVALKREDITFQPIETIKGLSVKDSWLIVDEAEDLTIDEAQKVITRIGEGSRLVLAGDITQSELNERSGLKWLVEFASRHKLEDIIGHIDFDNPNDIVRSNSVKRIIVGMLRDKRVSK